MSDAFERRAAGLVVQLFRFMAGRHQYELSERTGIDTKRISRYEQGKIRPHRATLERLAAGVGVSANRLDQLLSLFLTICVESAAAGNVGVPQAPAEPERSDWPEDLAELAAEIAEDLQPEIYQALRELDAELNAPAPPLSPEAARDQARELWRRFEPLPDRIRRLLIEHGEEYQTWAFCERLCEASLEAAAQAPQRGQNLADLALSVAESAQGSEVLRQRLTAFALATAARADSLAGEPEEAAEKLARARDLWRAGDGTDDLDPGPTAAWAAADA